MDFSIPVTLSSGVANRFIVTATDMADNVSPPCFAPIIYQGDVQTAAGSWTGAIGNTSINVRAPYTGDSNGNNAGKVRWRTPAARRHLQRPAEHDP